MEKLSELLPLCEVNPSVNDDFPSEMDNSAQLWDFYPMPFWPTGIVIACVCVRLSVCVSTLLVCVITHHSFKLGSPDLDQKMQNILLKVPIVSGTDGT